MQQPFSTADSLMASPQTAPTGGGVLRYNGRQYAVGLLWLTVQEDTQKKLLQERIRKTGADFYCERTHIAQQQGFGWMAQGHRRGMQAAAAMIADQLVGEWHGVFEADNGWWYVQVRSDTITPNGDRFFSSEEEAFQVFQEEAQKNIWPHSYVPERWHLSDSHTRELPLRNLLDDLTTTPLVAANLTAMFGSAGLRNLVLGGVLLCFLVMAGLVAHTLSKPVAPPPPRKPRVTRTIEAPPQQQVAEAVSPLQLLRQCGEAADKLYHPIPGWLTDSFTCTSGKATMAWKQEGGRLATARDMAASIWPADAMITLTNRQMSVSLKLGNLPKVERQKPVTQESALVYLEQHLQPLGNLQIKPVTPRAPRQQRPATTRGSRTPPPPPVVQPSYLDIRFVSGYGPDHVAALLEAPGLELVNVQWQILQAQWQYNLKWVYDTPRATTAAATNGAATATPSVTSEPAPAAQTPSIQGQQP